VLGVLVAERGEIYIGKATILLEWRNQLPSARSTSAKAFAIG